MHRIPARAVSRHVDRTGGHIGLRGTDGHRASCPCAPASPPARIPRPWWPGPSHAPACSRSSLRSRDQAMSMAPKRSPGNPAPSLSSSSISGVALRGKKFIAPTNRVPSAPTPTKASAVPFILNVSRNVSSKYRHVLPRSLLTANTEIEEPGVLRYFTLASTVMRCWPDAQWGAFHVVQVGHTRQR